MSTKNFALSTVNYYNKPLLFRTTDFLKLESFTEFCCKFVSSRMGMRSISSDISDGFKILKLWDTKLCRDKNT